MGGTAVVERKTAVVPIESDKESVAKQALLRYYNGEPIETIALSYGFKSAAPLLSAIIKHCPKEWKHVRTGIVLAAKESVDAQLHSARLDMGELRRCEVATKAIQWELERVQDSVYNAKNESRGPATTIVLNIADIHGTGKRESVTFTPIGKEDGVD